MFEKEAEEWTISHVCKDCSRYEECKSKEHCTCKECSKEKWQNGAMFGYDKANEWHDLRNNPEDLPSDVGWVSNQDGLPCYYEWATERWLNCRDIEIKVTAWCDMPSLGEDFSEEEE